MQNIKLYLEWVVSAWLGLQYQNPYSKEWNEVLGVLLDYAEETNDYSSTEYCLTIKGTEIWIANRFYAYGSLEAYHMPERRPSLKNMIRLAKLQDKVNAKYKEETRKIHQEKYQEIINKIKEEKL